MGEVFLIFGLVVLAAVIFAVWFVVALVKLIFRAVAGNGSGAATRSTAALRHGWSSCRQSGCHAANPDHARFCRRCGHALAHANQQAARMRYVA